MYDLTVRIRKTEVQVLKVCNSDRRAQKNSAGTYKYKPHSAWSTQQLYELFYPLQLLLLTDNYAFPYIRPRCCRHVRDGIQPRRCGERYRERREQLSPHQRYRQFRTRHLERVCVYNDLYHV